MGLPMQGELTRTIAKGGHAVLGVPYTDGATPTECDRVEPGASPTISVIVPKAEVNSELSECGCIAGPKGYAAFE